VIRAVEAAGIGFDAATGTGVVLHMLSGLQVNGRFGLTAIGRTPEDAETLHRATTAVVGDLAAARAGADVDVT
jgi:hypothetical protein